MDSTYGQYTVGGAAKNKSFYSSGRATKKNFYFFAASLGKMLFSVNKNWTRPLSRN